MRYAPRALLAGGLGLALSWLVACGGGGGLLSSDQASNLNNQLDALSQAVQAGQCGAASHAVVAFNTSVSNLPPTVSPALRSNLQQGASTVASLAERDCHSSSTQPSTSSTTPTTTTTTPSSSSTTTPSTTSTTTPSTTSTTPATSTTTPGTTSTTTPSGGGGLGIGGGAGSGGAGTGATSGNGGNGT